MYSMEENASLLRPDSGPIASPDATKSQCTMRRTELFKYPRQPPSAVHMRPGLHSARLHFSPLGLRLSQLGRLLQTLHKHRSRRQGR